MTLSSTCHQIKMSHLPMKIIYIHREQSSQVSPNMFTSAPVWNRCHFYQLKRKETNNDFYWSSEEYIIIKWMTAVAAHFIFETITWILIIGWNVSCSRRYSFTNVFCFSKHLKYFLNSTYINAIMTNNTENSRWRS